MKRRKRLAVPPIMGPSWRLCPPGYHYVSACKVAAYIRSDGTSVCAHQRSAHCALNSSKKDQIYVDEMLEISRRFFGNLSGLPTPNAMNFARGNEFDALIRGWVAFWNDMFRSSPPIDPNLVKALIATESSFNPAAKNRIPGTRYFARGLMQLTDPTLKILSDEKGELRDHLVNVTQDNMNDPSLNIAAGVRWLHRKQETAMRRLGRPPTAEEIVAEYKGILSGMISESEFELELIQRFQEFYFQL